MFIFPQYPMLQTFLSISIAPGALAPQVALPQGVSFDADQQRYTAGGCFFASHQGMSSTRTSSPGA